MLYTRQMAADNIRNRDKKRVFYLAKGDSLTSEARDYLAAQRIEILPAEQARQSQLKLLSGGYVTEKPEHLTHLNGDCLVPKTHPRIAFRGQMDMLEASLLQTGKAHPHLQKELGEMLTLARQIIKCDVLEQALEAASICGFTEEELRHRSHFPQKYYGIPHFMPEFSDSGEVLALNRVRTQARQAELAAAHAFADREGRIERTDILQALNRISSMLYILMIREKAAYGTTDRPDTQTDIY